jgi:hypothetical protein
MYPIPSNVASPNMMLALILGGKFVLHVDEGFDQDTSSCALVLQERPWFLHEQAKTHEEFEEGCD